MTFASHARRPPCLSSLLVVLLSVLLHLCPPPASSAVTSSGLLLLRVACYEHPSNLQRNGKRCSRQSDCSPKFHFCLSTSPSDSHRCDLLNSSPFAFSSALRLGECASVPDNFPSPISLTVATSARRLFLSVGIQNVDRRGLTSREEEIDLLSFSLWPSGLPHFDNGATPPASQYKPLNASSRHFDGPQQPRLQLLGVLQCQRGRFGPYCDSTCAPTERHTCDEDGGLLCRPGWRGLACQERDPCAAKPGPCKAWAECRSAPAGGFDCFCDGRTGPQCVAGADPCLNHRCQNNATCVGRESRPVCRCAPGWVGPRCESRQSCRLPGRCGAHGRCLALPGDEEGACVCDAGYAGSRCELRTGEDVTTTPSARPMSTPNYSLVNEEEEAENSKRVTVILVVLLILVLLGISMIIVLCYLQNRGSRARGYAPRAPPDPVA